MNYWRDFKLLFSFVSLLSSIVQPQSKENARPLQQCGGDGLGHAVHGPRPLGGGEEDAELAAGVRCQRIGVGGYGPMLKLSQTALDLPDPELPLGTPHLLLLLQGLGFSLPSVQEEDGQDCLLGSGGSHWQLEVGMQQQWLQCEVGSAGDEEARGGEVLVQDGRLPCFTLRCSCAGGMFDHCLIFRMFLLCFPGDRIDEAS